MIGAYLIHTITMKQFKGKDVYGDPVTPTSVLVKARVEFKESVVQGVGVELVTSKMRVIMRTREVVVDGFDTRGTNTISYLDTIRYLGVDHHILQIATLADFRDRYMEVYLA